jgi:hypothetical protein
MMINGFTPRISFLSPPVTTSQNISTLGNLQSTQGLSNTPVSTTGGSFTNTGLSGWNLGSMGNISNLFSPFGQAVNSMSQFGSQLISGAGQSLSSLGQMASSSLPSLSSLNLSMIQPQTATSSIQSTQTVQQPVFQSLSSGAGQAIQDLGSLLQKNAPAALAMGGAMVGGGAVCAFMGGAMAATGGIMMGNQMAQAPASHPAV